MELTELVSYVDDYLRVLEVPDAPHAINGLQVANAGTVSRLAAAVDLCEATVRMAAEQGADLLLVHHGLFWGGLQPLTGRAYRRVAGLMAQNIALYSAHLPLDLHPDVGNNAVLARQLGVSLRGEFGEEYGVRIGRWGETDVSRDALERRLAALTSSAPRLMAFGPERVRRVGIVTGAARAMIAQAAAAGRDTFSTGEGPHHTFLDAGALARRPPGPGRRLARGCRGPRRGVRAGARSGHCAADAHRRGAGGRVSAGNEDRRRVVSRRSGTRDRCPRRRVDAGLGASPSHSLGGSGRVLAARARHRGGGGAPRRPPGPARAARRPVRHANPAGHLAGRAEHPRRPCGVARQPRLPRSHVGAVCDVDVAGRVRGGERSGPDRWRFHGKWRAGVHHIRGGRERRVGVLAGRKVR